MRILLVGNYLFDASTSMHIWAGTLERELLRRDLEVRLISPQPLFGRWKPSAVGFGKWLGYIDRYLLFPFVLRAAAAKADVVHICDHGNAMYCSMLNGKATVVTCHDMLAVRGALGELPEMRASRFGIYLQRWICRGLRKARRVACVSRATFDDACQILGRCDHARVVLNALNYPFQPLDRCEAEKRLAEVKGIDGPFVLHVGSSHARKNRDGVLRVFARLAPKSDLRLVLAGAPLDAGLQRLADKMDISGRIVQLIKPDVGVIEALYNCASALLFPSRHEGFGWPPIEAQACGCPVVASDIPTISEVLRDTAVLHSIDDEAGMADSIMRLSIDREFREAMRCKGFENVRERFQISRMMEEYIALYREAEG